MLNKTVVAKAGTLLLFDRGEYSDYCVIGLFKAEKDFNPYEVLEGYLVENPENRDDYGFEADRFIAFLLANGYVTEAGYHNFYLGGYGDMVGSIDYR